MNGPAAKKKAKQEAAQQIAFYKLLYHYQTNMSQHIPYPVVRTKPGRTN